MRFAFAGPWVMAYYASVLTGYYSQSCCISNSKVEEQKGLRRELKVKAFLVLWSPNEMSGGIAPSVLFNEYSTEYSTFLLTFSPN